jgi:hypothetical protein
MPCFPKRNMLTFLVREAIFETFEDINLKSVYMLTKAATTDLISWMHSPL